MPTQFVDADTIARNIRDGSTVLTVGMTLVSAAEAILKAIETRFLREGHPRDLTLVHCSGQSNRESGIQHLAHEGLVTRIIGSHWGLAPRWMEMISADAVLAYCLPQGQMTHWLRSMASGLPGHLTSIGLGTFIDPRQEGGKMNRRTQAAPDLVQVVTIRGEEFLWLDAVPIDWVIIRGTTADSQGNISAEEEPMRLEILPAVFAGRRWDGTVVAQVKRVVERGQIPPRLVEVPGPHVHYVVRAESPEHDHRQTSSWVYDPNFSEIGYRPSVREEAEPVLDIRRVIGRRAALEAGPGNIINMGTGIPNDIIGAEMVHEGVDDLVTLTVESGVYGGRPVGGVDFGIAKNPDALIEHPYQFDFYNGRGVDVTFMGFGEMDSAGNVNATKLGERATGAGGFIDITQCAKKVVFCGTFTARGLNVDIGPGFIRVLEEGRVLKCVDHVQQISFNGRRAVQQGQTVVVVTERAVFHLGAEGWVLDEIAPGIDLYRDVLARMAFTPIIPAVLPSMDPVIFTEAALGLRDRWCPTSTPRSSH